MVGRDGCVAHGRGQRVLALFARSSALAFTATIIFFVGRKYFGERSGLFAALGLLLCMAGVKQLALARTDGVFALAVTVAAARSRAAGLDRRRGLDSRSGRPALWPP